MQRIVAVHIMRLGHHQQVELRGLARDMLSFRTDQFLPADSGQRVGHARCPRRKGGAGCVRPILGGAFITLAQALERDFLRSRAALLRIDNDMQGFDRDMIVAACRRRDRRIEAGACRGRFRHYRQ